MVVPHSEHLCPVAIVMLMLMHPPPPYRLRNDPSNKELLAAGTHHYPQGDGHLIIMLSMLPTF